MSKTYTTQSLNKYIDIHQVADYLTSPRGLTLVVVLILYAVLNLFEKKGGKLATSYWAGKTEKKNAKAKAIAQIKSPKHNSAALYVSRPDAPTKSTLFVPDAQRGTLAIGAAGSGKTYSIIDPLVLSAIDQGFPLMVYDFKYPIQTMRSFAYALQRGYKCRVFCPGYPESETCNVLEFIEDSQDAVAAGQLSKVIIRNLDTSKGKASADPFFEDAGESLLEGVFLLTKAVGELTGNQEYEDIMTASAILELSQLPERLERAANEKLIVWTSRPLMQLVSVKESEKTVASIIGTTQKAFQKFVKKAYIGAFCGKSTMPIEADEKVIYYFGLDRYNRDIIGPLLAAVLHMYVTKNVSRRTPRKLPLVVSLDEVRTIFLPYVVNWLSENREDGFCGLLGTQTLGLLEDAYGKALTEAIIGNCANKAILNPQSRETADYFSSYLGEMPVEFESKSISRGKGNRSSSRNEQFYKRPLFEAAQFNKLPTGKSVYISSGFSNDVESYVPSLMKIRIPKANRKAQEWSIRQWQRILPKLIARRTTVSDREWQERFQERRALVQQLFPLPVKSEPNSVPPGQSLSSSESIQFMASHF